MIQHSESIANLMGAMLKVQGTVDSVRKDSRNPHFKAGYASLEAVVDTIRPACQEAGLVVMLAPGEFAGQCITVEAFIAHAASGEWLRSAMQLPVQKNDPQGVGSAITYGERYSLMALFAIPAVDDDGEAASRPEPPRTAPRPASNAPAPANTPVNKTGVLTPADKLMLHLSTAKSATDLNEMKADPDFKAQYKALAKPDQDRVADHGRQVSEKFTPTQMAG